MVKKERNPLGRGLDALLGEVNETEKATQNRSFESEIPIEFLHPGKFQPRRLMDEDTVKQLADSIRQKGIIQPILVRASPEIKGHYEIIAGERRWRAAQIAQLHNVPVLIKKFNDEETLELALIENLQRQDLSPLEEAEGYKRLMEEFGHTQEKLASNISKSRSHIANMIRLLNLPDSVKKLVDNGRLSIGHARAILSAKSPHLAAEYIVKKKLSVRETEKFIKNLDGRREKNSGATVDVNVAKLESRLSSILGLPAKIQSSGQTGTLKIRFSSLDQLDHILEKLGLKEHLD